MTDANGRKRGSIALARSLCYQVNGAADDSDNMDGGGYGSVDIAEILSAEVVRLQKALAQTEQEPVAEAYALADKVRTELDKKCCPVAYMNVAWEAVVTNYRDLIHTTPPKRTWVGLTDEDIALIDWESLATKKDCARAIEAKLRSKNT